MNAVKLAEIAGDDDKPLAARLARDHQIIGTNHAASPFKISAGTRSDVGRDCRDAFLSLAKTCDKLGIAV